MNRLTTMLREPIKTPARLMKDIKHG